MEVKTLADDVHDVKDSADFLGLPWVDVIFSRIFLYLTLSDISRCRRISKTFNELCLLFYKCCRRLDFSPVARRLTERAFVKIASETTNLRVLILENCKTIVRDPIIVEVLQNNPQLICVNFSRCTSLTSQCLLSIGDQCPKLCELYLQECRWITPQGVINVALSCKSLEVVDLSGCWEVNDDCIIVLVSSCLKITHLSLNGCYGITDQSLHSVSHNLSKLMSLELNGCWRVTNHAIQLIGEYCRELTFLSVKECRNITAVSLARLWTKGVAVNGEPAYSQSTLREMPQMKLAMHMTPFVQFNPS